MFDTFPTCQGLECEAIVILVWHHHILVPRSSQSRNRHRKKSQEGEGSSGKVHGVYLNTLYTLKCITCLLVRALLCCTFCREPNREPNQTKARYAFLCCLFGLNFVQELAEYWQLLAYTNNDYMVYSSWDSVTNEDIKPAL